MRLPDAVTTAFRKLVAPRPIVLLFHDVPGFAWHAIEVPETFQVTIGLSWELAREIDAKMFMDTGKRLFDVAEVREVAGLRHVIAVHPGYRRPVDGSEGSIFAATIRERDIVIEPKPLEFAEVTRL